MSGTLLSVFHEGTSASGNTNFTGTLVPKHVVLEDGEGNVYSLSGALWFGDTSNAQKGTSQGTFTAFFDIVSERCRSASTRSGMVAHFGANGDFSVD